MLILVYWLGWNMMLASTSSKAPARTRWTLPPELSTADSSAGVPSTITLPGRYCSDAGQRQPGPDRRRPDQVVAAAVPDVRQGVELGQDRHGRAPAAADPGPQRRRQAGDADLGLDPALAEQPGERRDRLVLLVPELRVAADGLGGLPERTARSVHLSNRLAL